MERTALADAEVEYQEHTSHTSHVPFPSGDCRAESLAGAADRHLDDDALDPAGNRGHRFCRETGPMRGEVPGAPTSRIPDRPTLRRGAGIAGEHRKSRAMTDGRLSG